MCNANPHEPRSLTPLLIPNDYAYMAIMLAFSVSNGYIGSVCLMSAPQVCGWQTLFMCVAFNFSPKFWSFFKFLLRILNFLPFLPASPQVCLPEEQQTAASLTVAMLGLGLGAGALSSNLFVKML